MYKLVIVDDESKIRLGLMNHYPWVELGFEVVGNFADGRMALDFMNENRVDVVLTDIRMPVMTGIELAQQIRERHPHTNVIFLSGYADFDYARQAIVNSVKDYILKPVKYDNIMSVFNLMKQELDLVNPTEPEHMYEGYYDKIIDAVESYIIDHMKDASLEGAALKVNLSPNYLSKVFKQKTGKTFSDFLFETKMKKSKELMADLNLKIYHISSAIGYNNPKNFSRAFKQYHGVSPRNYR